MSSLKAQAAKAFIWDFEFMVSQNVIPSKKYYGGTKPWIFTEKGLYMVVAIL